MISYNDFKKIYKQFSSLCNAKGDEDYPKILLDTFGNDNCNLLTNIPDYWCDYNTTFGDYIYDLDDSCLGIFYTMTEFFHDAINDLNKDDNDNKIYEISTLDSELSSCIFEFILACDELNNKLPDLFGDINDKKISELLQCTIKFRDTFLNIFVDYIDIKKLIIKYLKQKLDKKEKEINNILKEVKEYQQECKSIKTQLKEYENMV